MVGIEMFGVLFTPWYILIDYLYPDYLILCNSCLLFLQHHMNMIKSHGFNLGKKNRMAFQALKLSKWKEESFE